MGLRGARDDRSLSCRYIGIQLRHSGEITYAAASLPLASVKLAIACVN